MKKFRLGGGLRSVQNLYFILLLTSIDFLARNYAHHHIRFIDAFLRSNVIRLRNFTSRMIFSNVY